MGVWEIMIYSGINYNFFVLWQVLHINVPIKSTNSYNPFAQFKCALESHVVACSMENFIHLSFCYKDLQRVAMIHLLFTGQAESYIC